MRVFRAGAEHLDDVHDDIIEGLDNPQLQERFGAAYEQAGIVPGQHIRLAGQADGGGDLLLTGKRANGYHELDSLVVFAEVGDLLTLRPAPELAVECQGPFAADLPAGVGLAGLRGLLHRLGELDRLRPPALTAGVIALSGCADRNDGDGQQSCGGHDGLTDSLHCFSPGRNGCALC